MLSRLRSRFLVFSALFLGGAGLLPAQRSYAPVSVLASGNWYRIAVKGSGIYRMDAAFLNSLGLGTAGLSSSSIRLFGNGGQMLPESNAEPRADDLVENAIWLSDGGDGVFDGNDYILFYAAGPDTWLKDSLNRRFEHRKNLYSDESYYYLTVGGTGKRLVNLPPGGPSNFTVTGYWERFFHERDSVNFLSSGKEWYGEEFSNLPGRSLTRSFFFPLPGLEPGTPVTVRYQCVSRSVGVSGRFDLRMNNQPAGQLPVPSVSGGIYDWFAREATAQVQAPVSGDSLQLSLTYVPGSLNAQGWLNWVEVFYRRALFLAGSVPLRFSDWDAVGPGRVAEFQIRNATSATRVWDITDPLQPARVSGTYLANEYRFTADASRLREYIAFDDSFVSSFPLPLARGAVSNQNLHASQPADMLLVANATLLPQAERLAEWHRQRDGLRTRVVSTQQVFQEFSGGSPDPVAIRDFVKMYYDRYRLSSGNELRYLLLFGDASFDYRNRLAYNSNLVPAWQNGLSLDPLSTYTSDDFYGFLDDQEDINSGQVSNLLDIGIGRIPAGNLQEAKNFVDKLERYGAAAGLGPWRTQLCLVADDEDNNLHFQDAELLSATAATAGAVFNQQKIYLDAFRQESGAGGNRYPEAERLNNSQLFNGTLIWNYSGHGGYARLAEENILDQSQVNGWKNADRLPLFVTATCDFAPYDNPGISSLGENLLLRPQTGGIALMTTTRPVFAFSNRVMNNNYLRFALEQGPDGRYRSLGDAMKDAKNFTYQNLADLANNRKFTLLGDPALHLAFPRLYTAITRVNGRDASLPDTLSALENVIMEGEVRDQQGQLLTDFNGHVYPVVYDKPQDLTTRGNDPGSQPAAFSLQQNALFKGKATVSGGRFSFSFKVPKDINYRYAPGRVSLYAENGLSDAAGFYTGVWVGGDASVALNDREGPRIRAWLNDRSFVNGGISNSAPLLLVALEDSSGINTTGTGIGHDISATLDNDNRQYFILNDFYQAERDSYQRGELRFPLPALEPGPHTLRIRAWDVVNNSSEINLDFVVASDEALQVSRVLNYPNPFTTRTAFWFEHNQPGQALQVEIRILTLTGRHIRTIRERVTTEGNRYQSPEWDGRDEFGDRPGRGVYLYRLRVSLQGKPAKELTGKLVIL